MNPPAVSLLYLVCLLALAGQEDLSGIRLLKNDSMIVDLLAKATTT